MNVTLYASNMTWKKNVYMKSLAIMNKIPGCRYGDSKGVGQILSYTLEFSVNERVMPLGGRVTEERQKLVYIY